jgi:hypothetical protein
MMDRERRSTSVKSAHILLKHVAPDTGTVATPTLGTKNPITGACKFLVQCVMAAVD